MVGNAAPAAAPARTVVNVNNWWARYFYENFRVGNAENAETESKFTEDVKKYLWPQWLLRARDVLLTQPDLTTNVVTFFTANAQLNEIYTEMHDEFGKLE